MIKYSLYLDGGELKGEVEVKYPLKRGHRITTKRGERYKVLRVTRRDIVEVLGPINGIAYVRER
jgi:hypothetical protein